MINELFLMEVKEEIMSCFTREEVKQVVEEYKLYDSNYDLMEPDMVKYSTSPEVVDHCLKDVNFVNKINIYSKYLNSSKQEITKENKRQLLEWLTNDNNYLVIANCKLDKDNFKDNVDFIMSHYEDNNKPLEFIEYYNQNQDKIITELDKVPTSYIVRKDDIEKGEK